MAKKAAKKEAPAKAAAKPEFKYGIANVEEATGRDAASIRRSLRAADQFEKNSGVWGWNTKSDFEAVVKHIKAGAAPAADKEKAPAKGKSKKSKKSKD